MQDAGHSTQFSNDIELSGTSTKEDRGPIREQKLLAAAYMRDPHGVHAGSHMIRWLLKELRRHCK